MQLHAGEGAEGEAVRDADGSVRAACQLAMTSK